MAPPMAHEPTTTSPEAHRFEDYPLTRVEYITAMVHFYRAEVSRSMAWRQRLDATTNWAVLTTAGMLSFSFSSDQAPHIVMLLTNLILVVYLGIEARRYRYFAVYRARVRMIEENFLIPIVTRQLESPMTSWREMLAMDLDLPKYKTTFLQALGLRLRRNYVWICMVVFGGWIVKIMIHPRLAESWSEFWSRMAIGHIPPVVVVLGWVVFAGLVMAAIWYARSLSGGTPEDEISGLERNLKHWKI
jgi:uncharacterized membrane protein